MCSSLILALIPPRRVPAASRTFASDPLCPAGSWVSCRCSSHGHPLWFLISCSIASEQTCPCVGLCEFLESLVREIVRSQEVGWCFACAGLGKRLAEEEGGVEQKTRDQDSDHGEALDWN